jgi:hypothetical protein
MGAGDGLPRSDLDGPRMLRAFCWPAMTNPRLRQIKLHLVGRLRAPGIAARLRASPSDWKTSAARPVAPPRERLNSRRTTASPARHAKG